MLQMSPDEDDEEFWSRLKSIPSDCRASVDYKPEGDETVAAQDTNPCHAPLVTEAVAPEEVSVLEHEETRTHPKPTATVTRQDSSEDPVENAETSTTSDSAPSEDPQEENHDDDDDKSAVPREKILKRISSKKETKSYQLGKQVSFKWTTGAGPRIVCVRDYPSELQLRALEQVHLSPRSGGAVAGRAASSRFASPQRSSSLTARGRCEQLTLGGGGRAASSRFASPQRSSSPMARGRCEPLTPREAFRTHLMARG